MQVIVKKGTQTVKIQSPQDFLVDPIKIGEVVKVHIKPGQKITVTPASALKQPAQDVAARGVNPGGVIIIEIIDDI
jgi:hypothetical protein